MQKKGGVVKYLLAAVNLIACIGVIAWPIAAFLSMFFFDSPGSKSSILTWMLAASVLLYPVPAIIGNIRFWKAWKNNISTSYIPSTAISASGYLLILAVIIRTFAQAGR